MQGGPTPRTQVAPASWGGGTISRRIFLSGQPFPQFLRRELEELPETQVGQLHAQQAVRRLTFAAAYSKAA